MITKNILKNKTLIIIVSVVVITSNFQVVSGEVFFPSTNVRVDGPSRFCTIIPTDYLVQNKSVEWVKLTEKAVSEWEQKLKDAENENDDYWDLDVKIVNTKESGCDILIEFKDKPSLSDTVAGFFSWPPGKITVYYLQPKLCTMTQICYDDETLKGDDTIYAIIIHEIGHSLGLDHYVSDDNEINKKWQSGSESPPSVMIPTIPRNPNLLQITDLDIKKIREIYGSEGFNAFAIGSDPKILPKPTPEQTPEPIIPVSPITAMDISQKVIEADKYGRQIITLSGSIHKEEYHRGLPVIITIHKPDDSVEVLKISASRVGYFETLLIFDNESIKGTYHISASYLGHVDKNKDITFEVIGKNPDSSKTSPTLDPQIDTDSKLKKTLNFDEQRIPSWIKNNAKWWASGKIGDHAFVSGIKFLIGNGVLQVPPISELPIENFGVMPPWIKNIAGYWANDKINDNQFITSIQYLVEKEIIVVP